VLILTALTCGIGGFITETIQYSIKEGHFVKRGFTFGPWGPIYVCGGLIILLFTYQYKKYPMRVLIINSLTLGTLEGLTGWVLDKFFHKRLWDYSKSLLNINGYVCLHSVLLFGIGSLIVIYLLIPQIVKLQRKTNTKTFTIISIGLFTLFIIDVIFYALIH